MAPQDVPQGHHFITGGIPTGRREQPRRQTDGTRLQGFCEHRLHVLQFVVARCPIVRAHGHQPQGVMACLHDGVD